MLYPFGRTCKIIKDRVLITNATNLLEITKNITLTVIDYCAPPPIRLAARRVTAVGLITVSITNPNSYTIGTFIHLVTDIYNNY